MLSSLVTQALTDWFSFTWICKVFLKELHFSYISTSKRMHFCITRYLHCTILYPHIISAEIRSCQFCITVTRQDKPSAGFTNCMMTAVSIYHLSHCGGNMAENWVSVVENQAPKQIIFEGFAGAAHTVEIPSPCQDYWCYGDINTESCLEFFIFLAHQTYSYFGYKKNSTRFWFPETAKRNFLYCTGKDEGLWTRKKPQTFSRGIWISSVKALLYLKMNCLWNNVKVHIFKASCVQNNCTLNNWLFEWGLSCRCMVQSVMFFFHISLEEFCKWENLETCGYSSKRWFLPTRRLIGTALWLQTSHKSVKTKQT